MSSIDSLISRGLRYFQVPNVDVHELLRLNMAASGGSNSKAESRSFRERLNGTTYRELHELLSKVKLSHLLNDEPCTLGVRFGVTP